MSLHSRLVSHHAVRHFWCLAIGSILTGALLSAGCTGSKPTGQSQPPLENLMQVSDSVYSGGQPHGEEAFAYLAASGVKTVVSVDGARPDVKSATRHGLRYVHIPMGYEGVSAKARGSLTRLMKEADGPFYIHCHHGRHRAPAAAAIACIVSGEVRQPDALAILERAGTSRDYAGLWRDVAGFRMPGPGEELPELLPVAEVGDLAQAMAGIDRIYDDLKRIQSAHWTVPEEHPDLAPVQTALLLKEGLRESARNAPEEATAELVRWLKKAEKEAAGLEQALRSGEDPILLNRRFLQIRKSCADCHSKYRDEVASGADS